MVLKLTGPGWAQAKHSPSHALVTGQIPLHHHTSTCQAMVRVKHRTRPTQALHKNWLGSGVYSSFTGVSENISNQPHNCTQIHAQMHLHWWVFVTCTCITVHQEYPALALYFSMHCSILMKHQSIWSYPCWSCMCTWICLFWMSHLAPRRLALWLRVSLRPTATCSSKQLLQLGQIVGIKDCWKKMSQYKVSNSLLTGISWIKFNHDGIENLCWKI